MKRALVWAILMSGLASRAFPQDDPLEVVKKTLAEHRFEMTVDAGGISGPGADLLLCEAAAAQFVLIGEFHGTKEVPLFTAHLAERLRPAGFDVYCTEIGPISAEYLLTLLDSADAMGALEAFSLEHPLAIPLYNWREEAKGLTKIRGCGYDLWGLDAELEFPEWSRFLFERLVELAPNDAARALAEEWGARLERFWTEGVIEHNLEELFGWFPEGARDFGRAFAGAPAEARGIVREFTEAGVLRKLGLEDLVYEFGRRRARLMKKHFYEYLERRGGLSNLPRALFRFGAAHVGRGYNVENQLDVGNLAAELAAANGRDSLHVHVMSAEYLPHFPDEEKPFLDEHPDLAVCFAQAYGSAWVVLDLRSLRPLFHAEKDLAKGHQELCSFVWQHDLAIIVPAFHAATRFGTFEHVRLRYSLAKGFEQQGVAPEKRAAVLADVVRMVQESLETVNVQSVAVRATGDQEFVVEGAGVWPENVAKIKEALARFGKPAGTLETRFQAHEGSPEDQGLARNELDRLNRELEAYLQALPPEDRQRRDLDLSHLTAGVRSGGATFRWLPHSESMEETERESAEPPEQRTTRWGLVRIDPEHVITGEDLENIRPTQDLNGHPTVGFSIKAESQDRMREFTRANIGRDLCLVLDGEILSVARLRDVIIDEGQLSGGAKGFRQQDVLELVSLLKTPPLPYRAELVEEIIQ
ncbi:MAG: hypothetical protein AB1486_30185 [Planctomycetota bacterium]